jgi:short-subunit dehydrogenase
MKQLNGKTAVVTGAGSGIGRALAVLLAHEGVRLVLVDLDPQSLEETCGLVQSAGQDSVRSYQVDVTDRARVERLAQEAADLGVVDILINNAGVSSSGRVEDLSYEIIEWTLWTNFWGVVHGTKAFLPLLLAQPEAALVNVSSVYGLMGVPGQAAYCASKFAVRGFTEALRHEMHGRALTVILAYPGGVKTNIVRNSRSDFPVSASTLEQGRREFEHQLTTSPQRAACAIIEAIRSKKQRVLIGRGARTMDRLARWLPEHHDSLIHRQLAASVVWRELG